MLVPPKLHPGSGVRVVAPACSLSSMRWIDDAYLRKTEETMKEWGLTVTYGTHVREMDDFESSTIESRIEDLHDAFRDPSVHLVHCARGGFNCNQLLPHLDYDLIKKNPKILLGFSDITALGNAIYAKTGLVTYSGPSFYQFGFGTQLHYTFEYFEKCLFKDSPLAISPSDKWTDARFTPEKPDLPFEHNDGHWMLQEGSAEGTIIGGNLCTLNLLQGTPYMPSLQDSILFLEDDYESHQRAFDRNLQSLIHLPEFKGVRGLVIGRFQKATGMTRTLLTEIIASKRELRTLPVIANADFGHTHPMITFPIGGTATLKAAQSEAEIVITTH